MFRALPNETGEIPEPISDDFLEFVKADQRSTTGPDGTAIIEYDFRSGASNRSPTPKANLRREWVLASAEGYGTAVVPVRHEPLAMKALREHGELLVLVGLMKSD